MRVALDAGVVAHHHRAQLGDAAHVVAAEVDQHQVLGPLLGIGPQLRLQRAVLLGRAPAAAGARDRAHVDAAVLEAAEDLRRRADQHRALAAQEEEIGARIDQPQVAVDRERVDLQRDTELLREHHLEDVARLDVLLGPLHHLVKRLARGAAAHVHRRPQRLAGGR